MAHDKRIRLIQNTEKLGLALSLNVGMREASGEFIARMDADDLCAPERLEKEVAFLQNNPNIGLVGSFQEHFGTENWIHRPVITPVEQKVMLLFHCDVCHSTVMFRRELFIQNHLFYDKGFLAEDYELWTRVAKVTDIATIPEVLGKYRHESGNITNTKKQKLDIESGRITGKQLQDIFGIELLESDFCLLQSWSNVFQNESNIANREKMLERYQQILLQIWEKNRHRHIFNKTHLLYRLNTQWCWAKYGGDWKYGVQIDSIDAIRDPCYQERFRFRFSRWNQMHPTFGSKAKWIIKKILRPFVSPILKVFDRHLEAMERKILQAVDNRVWKAEENILQTMDGRIWKAEENILQTVDGRIWKMEDNILQTTDARIFKAEESILKITNWRIAKVEKGITQTVSGRIHQAEKGIAQTVDGRISKAEKDIAQTTDARIQQAEKDIAQTVDGRIQQAEKGIAQSVDGRISKAEGNIVQTTDARIQQAEKDIAQTVDGRVSKAEGNIVQTVDGRIQQAEKGITQTVDDRVSKAEGSIAQTVDTRIQQAEGSIAQSVDGRISKAEKGIAQTTDARIQQAEKGIAQSVDGRIQQAEKGIAQTTDARIQQAEKGIAQSVDGRVLKAEKGIAQTTDARIQQAEGNIAQTVDGRIQQAEGSIAQTTDARIQQAEKGIAQTVDGCVSKAEESINLRIGETAENLHQAVDGRIFKAEENITQITDGRIWKAEENILKTTDGRIWKMEQNITQNLNEQVFRYYVTKKKIVLLGTPSHDNIGDHAITLGECEFIRKYFPDYELYELSGFDLGENYDLLQGLVTTDDILFLSGGGNVTDMYLGDENIRRRVISDFSANKIVILPQTVYFSDSDDGQKELAVSKEIYNRHSDLTFFTRGAKSLAFVKKHFPSVGSYSMPDMATMLTRNYGFERKGILTVMRDINDESGIDNAAHDEIARVCTLFDAEYEKSTNLYHKHFSFTIRGMVVGEELKRFARHQVVVTDRLHGLVFAAITGTPCVVISSLTQKIKEYVPFFKDSNAVFFIDKDMTKLEGAVKSALSVKTAAYHIDLNVFEKMSKIIKGEK
jgi:exopolysaccharide biosynthesis predicted pyruvyltransferase EpsI/glycosyltransferase involved in cell wall biosynthesis